jgi:hypothetical protein
MSFEEMVKMFDETHDCRKLCSVEQVNVFITQLLKKIKEQQPEVDRWQSIGRTNIDMFKVDVTNLLYELTKKWGSR